MKFALALPVDHIKQGTEFVGQAAIVEMTRAAEEAGFDAVSVTEHPVPTARWLDQGGHYAQDPFVMLAMCGAVSTHIRLLTYLLVVPYRNPFISARAVASLDAFTGGRVTLGVGAGYLKAEFKALGVSFDDRNDRFDESLRAMRTAWETDEFTFKGQDFEALGNRILPRPAQAVVPLWIGGNSKEAIRRTVQFAQGWMPLIAPPALTNTTKTAAINNLEELAERVAFLKSYAAELGKPAPTDLIVGNIRPFSGAAGERADFEAAHEALAKVGVTWCPIHAAGATRAEWIDNVRRGGELIASVRGVRQTAPA
jgi:probable F420-dependent oxidoreductase